MFAEDLAPFFDTDAGFAQTATVGGSSFPVIFDNGYQGGMNALVETTGPICQAKTADVSGVDQGDTMTIGTTDYTVVSVQPDGTGVTTFGLRA
jgi:hypothetical protein